MMEDRIQETLEGLKDFQLKTVDYVFKQLYSNGRNKMLIADEVGLGKTIVAKGLIAKAFSQFQPTATKKTFNVVYICSNQALAKQNLSKLNFTKDPRAVNYSDQDDRITALAYATKAEQLNFPVSIKAFTPATSFDNKTHAGKLDERLLLYRLLSTYKELTRYNLRWVLIGNRQIGVEKWNNKIDECIRFDRGKIDKGNKWVLPYKYAVKVAFRKRLEEKVEEKDLPQSFKAAGATGKIKLWTLLTKLCETRVKQNKDYYYAFSKELVSKLRFELSKCCIEFLQADIFILDEFQRYKTLIDYSYDEDKISPAIELAREVFSMDQSKILMLSATPFKPYTNDFDELNGEVHYNEFMTVLKFLMQDKADDFWITYEHDRKVLFGYLRHPPNLEANLEDAKGLKSKMESLYRNSIVRTEKLLASNEKDAMIKYVNKPITIQADDINDFVVLDQITLLLNDKPHNASLAVPLEYVKSCPFALSFLDHYQHKEKIRSLVLKDAQLRKLLKQTKHGWVNLDDIRNYKPLVPKKGNNLPNAKLRLLLDETVHNNGWKYLWIPPSIPYYELEGAFKNSWGYSKTLIFSSWKMVPKMVASLVSYEAERLSVGNPNAVSEREKKENPNHKPYYFQKRRSPRPQFTFKVLMEEQEPQQMNNFILSYPCMFLANFYDPVNNLLEKKSVQQIKTELKKKLVKVFNDLNLNQYVNGKGDWQKWYWLAPLLLDKYSEHNTHIERWLRNGLGTSIFSMDSDNLVQDKDENSGKQKHFELALKAYIDSMAVNVGRVSKESLEILCEHLAELAIGSPAICFLRSQQRHHEHSNDLLDSAYNVASAFFTMFNKPESIAIVRLFSEGGDYWERALNYMIDGNIQAMLDEFVYLMVKGEGIQPATELSEFITDILSVRTATSEIEDYPTFFENIYSGKASKKSMRAHYAVDFGTQKINTAKGAGRQISIRQAFNSPFRPFVLASTSIGQEGLDFHFYCKRIFHWNLPCNPIDFEQREGRIHRYQGLVIRLNLAEKYKDQLTLSNNNDVWQAIFECAKKEKDCAKFPCDLIPYWHTETTSDIKIERYVPLYPFSKDLEKYNNLIKILAFYRLTFGQPRQEELVDALHNSGFSDEAIQRLDDLIINLSPIKFS